MKYWMWPPNQKYSDENIPDPQKYLIGFYYANKNVNVKNQIFYFLLDTSP
jgi:hypothetical protein